MEKKMETTIVYWGYIGNHGKGTSCTNHVGCQGTSELCSTCLRSEVMKTPPYVTEFLGCCVKSRIDRVAT